MGYPGAFRTVAVAVIVLLLGVASARADAIVQVESLSISGLPGSAVAGFQAFDPTLGTLDRVNVRLDAVFTTTITLLPAQSILPVVEMDAFGLGGLGFELSLPAQFVFSQQVNGSPTPLVLPLATSFFWSFAATSVTDLGGIVVPSGGATGSSLLPGLVAVQREDFVARFVGDSVMEQFLFFPPAGVQPDAFTGGGTLSLEYLYTPAAAVVPEPASLFLLGAGILALGRRSRY